ncbi:MAG: undecaprenyldiphospho-muramoylpentapeptide beta-N-acetylglucosaminyltransferase [Pseudomonadota bacterium]
MSGAAMKGPILIMAGGTGGHVFPALAVAESLRQRNIEVRWLGAPQGMEADIVPKAGFPIDYVTISGLRGKGVLSWLTAPFKLLVAMWQSMRLIRRIKPAAVLGMGGFVTGPAGVMAVLLGRPLVIHEQNAIAGMTNRLLARIATRVLAAFPGAFKSATVTGNPVRTQIAALPAPAQRLRDHAGEPLHLLVLGGSLGAQALNSTVPHALALIPEKQRPWVWHQAGRRHIEAAQAEYRSAGITGQVVPFIEEMAEAYAWADIVLCRAGALTVSELAAAGVGAILVPYPHAVDDHQTSNAHFLVDQGAAVLIQQTALNAHALAALLLELASSRTKIVAMAEAARALAKPEATAEVVRHCLEVAHG